jgi:hypothetical protein
MAQTMINSVLQGNSEKTIWEVEEVFELAN